MKTRRRNKGGGNCGSQGCPAPVPAPVQKPVQKPVPVPSPVVKKTIDPDVYIAGLITKLKEGNKLVGEDLENYNVYLQKKAINDEKLKAKKIAKALLYPTKADQAAREQAARDQEQEQVTREQEQAAREQVAREQAAREQVANNQIANYNGRNPSNANKTIERAFTPKKGGNNKKSHKRKPRRSK